MMKSAKTTSSGGSAEGYLLLLGDPHIPRAIRWSWTANRLNSVTGDGHHEAVRDSLICLAVVLRESSPIQSQVGGGGRLTGACPRHLIRVPGHRRALDQLLRGPALGRVALVAS